MIAVGGAPRRRRPVRPQHRLAYRDRALPWSTFIENVSGCFLLGMLMVYLLDVWPPNRYLRPFLGVGVLGGFTTFSAYTSDTRAMLAHGEGPLAMVYFFGSILFGLLATWSGITLARTIAQDRVRDRYPSEDS